MEVSRPAAVLDFVLDPELGQDNHADCRPTKRRLPSRSSSSSWAWSAFLEYQLQTDWAGGVRKLIGGGITAAVGPKGETLL